MRTGTGGYSLVEVLVVLLLTSLLVTEGWRTFTTFREAGARAADSAEGLETVRTTAWLLGEELSGGAPGRDWWPGEGASVSLRAYRGVALVQGIDPGEGAAVVCYGGVRSPDLDKDSVLLLDGGGSWRAHALVSRVRREAGCWGGGEGWTEIWHLEPGPAGGALLGRVFERGSYHLVDGALRYRRGEGGRQPITPLRVGEGELERGGWEGEDGLRWSLRLSSRRTSGDTIPWSGIVR